MNKQNKKMQSLIFNFTVTLVLLVVTLFAFLSVHYGWFSNNRTVTATGMNISLDYDDTVALYWVYKYDTVRELGSKQSKQSATVTVDNTISNLELLTYDYIFIERNENNPVIFRIDMTGEKVNQTGTITVKLKRSTPDGSTMNTLVNSDDDGLFAYISSCVYFKASALSTLHQYFGDSNQAQNNLWKYGIEAFSHVSDSEIKRFVTCTSGDEHSTTRTYSKVDELTFSVTYTAEDWVDNTLSFFIFMDYDPTYVDYTYLDSHKNAQSGDLSSIALDLRNDFVMISSTHD